MKEQSFALPVRLGACDFDPARLELRGPDGAEVRLRPQAMRVLEHLIANAGRVVGRDELFAAVWPDIVVTDDSLVQCISDIRAAIGDEGHELLRTVPRRGYRLDLPAPEGSADLALAATAAGPESAPPASRRRMSARLGSALAALALLLVAGVAWLGWPGHRGAPDAGASMPFGARSSIAVLRFRGEGPGANADTLAAGFAEDLVGDLARNVDLKVVSARSSFTLDAQALSPKEIAQRLGVGYLLDGRVGIERDALRTRLQLIDGRDGRVVWTDQSEITVSTLASQREALLRRIAGSAQSSMRREQERRALAAAPASLDVYALTLRGYANKHRLSAEATRAARAELAEALRLDPNYAPAWAVLGYVNALDAANGITGDWAVARLPTALTQIDRAIALDPALALAHQARGVALIAAGRSADAVTAAEEAVRLAPGDADNWLFLANALQNAERVPESLQAMEPALALYPIEPSYVPLIHANVLWKARRYDVALKRVDECIVKAPGFKRCQLTRAWILAETGHAEQARREVAELRGAGGPVLPFSGGTERRRRLAEALGAADDPSLR